MTIAKAQIGFILFVLVMLAIVKMVLSPGVAPPIELTQEIDSDTRSIVYEGLCYNHGGTLATSQEGRTVTISCTDGTKFFDVVGE